MSGGSDDGDSDDGGRRGFDPAELLDRATAADHAHEIRNRLRPAISTESVPLDEAGGRTLAKPVDAPADQPDADRATMDGYAFDATDDYPLTVVSEAVYPEDDPPAIEPGEAVRIATGAPLPEGANAVLKREEATVTDESLTGPSIDPGTYVYARGSNVARGERLFRAGERLGARDAVLLRDLGIESVTVHRRPEVALLATGTEIHEGRSADLDSPMLANLVRAWGGRPTVAGSVPDDFERVRDRVADLAGEYDVVLTTGGTSVGRKDYAVRALRALGEVHFHGVAIRPGKPIAGATLAEYDAAAFAIPGKPVGAHTATTLVARPFFTGDRSLPAVEATFARDLAMGPSGFEYAVPVVLGDDAGGDPDETGGSTTSETPVPEAMPLGHVDSPLSVYDEQYDPSVLSSSTRATRADGVVLTRSDLAGGQRVRVHPYAVLER